MPTVSLIIPTVSRPSLARTLASLRIQPWRVGDEVILVGDGPQPQAHELWNQFGLPGRYVETPARANDWGHTPRNLFMPQARGDLIAALDDDDVWTPGALAAIRGCRTDRVHLFRMDARTLLGRVIWTDKDIRVGNVSTAMCVVPRDPARLGRYATDRYEGDHAFIQSTAALWDGAVDWHTEVICTVRPPRG